MAINQLVCKFNNKNNETKNPSPKGLLSGLSSFLWGM